MSPTLQQQLALPFAQHALIAALLVGVLAGAVGPFIVARRLAFGVHGLAELSFTGAAAGLVTGTGVVLGALGGTVLLALLLAGLSVRERDRDTVTGVLFAAGLGLGVLLLTGYQGFTREATAVLFGSIVGVGAGELRLLAVGVAVGLLALVVLWRPLRFASLDPDVAAARGVRVRLLGALFLLLVAVVVTETVQLAGTVLVLSLLTVPAAAAHRLTVAPVPLLALSILLAVAAAVGGVVLSIATNTRPSVCVVAVSTAGYVLCRAAGHLRPPGRRPSLTSTPSAAAVLARPLHLAPTA